MELKQIHKVLVSGRWTVFLSIVIVFMLRMFTHPQWNDWLFWGTFAIQIGIGLVLLQVNHSFTIIRSRTMLPAVLYLLFTGTSPSFYNLFDTSVAAFGVVLCLIFMFDSYQEKKSQINAFNLSMILTVCSILWKPMLLFFPLVWYGFYRFRCLSFRTFFATIIGALTVFLLVLTWSFYKEDIQIFLNYLPQKNELLFVSPFLYTIQDVSVSIFLLIIFIFAGFNIFISGISEKIRTSVFLRFLYFMCIYLCAGLLLQSSTKFNWTLVLYVPLSLVLSHYFTLSSKKSATWLLLVTIVFFLGMYVWQLIDKCVN